jgi:dipeptidase
MRNKALVLILFLMVSTASFGDEEGCTTITVGRLASAKGFVTTSHTCDSHRNRTSIFVSPCTKHNKGD